MQEVFVLSGVRTAIGDFGGALKDVSAIDLGAKVIAESLKRAGIEASLVSHAVVGTVVPTDPKDMYLSRVATIRGGLSKDSNAMNVNRLCGSGFQAIVSAAQNIMLGDADFAIGAGTESMSNGGYLSTTQRNGSRMGNSQMFDMMVNALTDPFDVVHMGMTAENIAEKWKFSRDDQDKFAVESHKRAAAAIAAGHFKSQILPVELVTRKGTTIFDTDEHVRGESSMESMAKLKTVFKKDGTVTAGNASGINDGAAALVLASGKAVKEKGLKPMARLVAYAHAGVEPNIMGIGPVPAVKIALAKAGLKVSDIDIIESNEAFAAQACAVAKDLAFDPAKTNPNGGAVALGHPIGATGVILSVKAIYELHRTNKRYALVTMCIGGGQGIAGIFERC